MSSYWVQQPPDAAQPKDFVYRQFFTDVTNYTRSRTRVANITANYSVPADIFYVRADATAGAITVTLPTASDLGGRQILVCKVDSSGNAVTVQRRGTDTIESGTSVTLSAQWDKTLLISNDVSGWEKL